MSLFGDNHNCTLVSDCEYQVGGTWKGHFLFGKSWKYPLLYLWFYKSFIKALSLSLPHVEVKKYRHGISSPKENETALYNLWPRNLFDNYESLLSESQLQNMQKIGRNLLYDTHTSLFTFIYNSKDYCCLLCTLRVSRGVSWTNTHSLNMHVLGIVEGKWSSYKKNNNNKINTQINIAVMFFCLYALIKNRGLYLSYWRSVRVSVLKCLLLLWTTECPLIEKTFSRHCASCSIGANYTLDTYGSI